MLNSHKGCDVCLARLQIFVWGGLQSRVNPSIPVQHRVKGAQIGLG
jgi:hypothetical protein